MQSYKTIPHLCFRNVWVSDRVYRIADWLIDFYEVQHGNGLARHLNVAFALDNHDAVRIWVHKQSLKYPRPYQTLGDLRAAFARLLP